MATEGYIKVWRKLFKHPIWLNSTPEQKCVLIALMEMANHSPKQWEWKGKMFTVERGQMITSIESIKQECGKGVSEQNVRTALSRFEKLEFLTNESTKTGRLITIENYNKWQGEEAEPNKEPNRQPTNRSQRPNKDLTPNKNDKNDKNDKNVYIADTSDFSPALKKAVEDWLTYKAERKESYQPKGLEMWLAQVRNKAKVYEDKHIADVIQRTMAAQYKGIVWDWLNDKPKKPKTPPPVVEVEVEDRISEEERLENIRRLNETLGGVFR